jgi:uncharacterized protein (TIGR02246 family)
VAGPLTEADRQEIAELFARYAWTMDTRDLDRFVENFAPDGAIVMPGVGSFEGRAEVRRYAEMLTGDPKYPGRQHFVSQSIFDGDSERCRVQSYGWVTRRGADGACAILSLGQYQDVVVKHEGRWVFAEREYRRWEGEVLERFGPL